MDGISRIDLSEPRILCVDADRRTQLWVKRVLRHVTARVTGVATGREAFNMLAREKFDLCILDYALPDMVGVQLCSLVRNMGCDVPMMVFTAMDRPIDRRRADEFGVDAFLTKTADLGRFSSTVTALIEKKRAGSAFPDATDLAKAA